MAHHPIRDSFISSTFVRHNHPAMFRTKQPILRHNAVSTMTATRLQILCWPISMLLLLLILPASGNLPPVSPSLTPELLARHYRDNHDGFRAGVVFVCLSAIVYPFYGIGVGNVLSRAPGVNPVMIMAQTAAGVVVGMVFMTSGILFGAITFRLDRDPVLIQLLSDLAWLFFTMMVPILTLQEVLIGWLIRSDRREKPMVPRWLAWANGILPVGWFASWGSHCVQNGPFAWDGALTFWFTSACYMLQLVVNVVFFWKAAGQVDDEESE
ncbi:hypothetical protein L249_8494 [Ophiocordyceps polyrhachis-furcata BCC 54312]|uniref:Uncharacterized protein n=1 Tax=Ophiocordyceps polyrhachis-furcata BCC 54312 TaxID=1330021 RepID=A0A367L6M7_9HYPO|nr:hypothetical protein L249_8494 [Ophiocordyceps polyrhachis-furcata BCC 54312]